MGNQRCPRLEGSAVKLVSFAEDTRNHFTTRSVHPAAWLNEFSKCVSRLYRFVRLVIARAYFASIVVIPFSVDVVSIFLHGIFGQV